MGIQASNLNDKLVQASQAEKLYLVNMTRKKIQSLRQYLSDDYNQLEGSVIGYQDENPATNVATKSSANKAIAAWNR